MVTAYGDRLPRLQAEETLALVQAHAAASGSMKRPDLDRYLRNLRREAKGREKARPATGRDLAAMKIKTEGG